MTATDKATPRDAKALEAAEMELSRVLERYDYTMPVDGMSRVVAAYLAALPVPASAVEALRSLLEREGIMYPSDSPVLTEIAALFASRPAGEAKAEPLFKPGFETGRVHNCLICMGTGEYRCGPCPGCNPPSPSPAGDEVQGVERLFGIADEIERADFNAQDPRYFSEELRRIAEQFVQLSEQNAALTASLAFADKQTERLEELLEPYVSWEGRPSAFEASRALLAEAESGLEPFASISDETRCNDGKSLRYADDDALACGLTIPVAAIRRARELLTKIRSAS